MKSESIKSLRLTAYKLLTKKLTRPGEDIAEYAKKEKVYELQYHRYSNVLTPDLSNPKSKIAILFVSATSACGLSPGKWYFVINNKIYRRITYKDINKKVTSGLKATRDSNLIYYVTPINSTKEQKKEIIDVVMKKIGKSCQIT